jgi:GNAT superfamily N-acetyltransferase
MANNYYMRSMRRKELDIAVSWAAKEGWNPGIYDADCFWTQDSKGFFIGLLNGKSAATVSAVRYDKSYGFMGFYIVRKESRGKRYGMKLFQKAWDYLGERNKGGDGVLENLKKYAKVGLKLAHYNARYQGFGSQTKKIEFDAVELSSIPFSKLAKYDDKVFGFPRHKFLKLWVSRPKTKAFGVVKNGELQGYGVIRKCFKGYKIGPLFANNDIVAKKLFDSLVGQISKKDEVFFDPPECNKFAVKLAKDYKMKKVFATGRIYTKGQPNFPLEKWYGVTSFELG